MKKFFLLGLLINASISFSQWSYVSTIPSGSNINCISVVNQSLVWVSSDSRGVFRTTNGGVNWDIRNAGLPIVGITSISGLDTSNCWIGTETGSIYKTTNGGSNWTLQFSLSGSFSDGIKMFNQNDGIYYGDPLGAGQPHQWRYTTDGGTNWLLSPNAPLALANEAGLLNAWDWTDSGKYWISTGNFTPSITSNRTFRTTIGFSGGGWTDYKLNGTGNSTGLYFSSIAFTSSSNGMTASNGTGNTLRKTTDGGVTWSAAPNPPGASNFIPFNMCGLKDGSNLIFLLLYTSSNKCFKTTDLGTTWQEETMPAQASSSLRLMQFVNHTLGYAGGGGGVFLRYGSSIGISMINTEVPDKFVLSQNYPNPFNPSTTINFSIPEASNISLKIYDPSGKEVSTIVNEFRPAGNYKVNYTADPGLNSGVYFYTMTAGKFQVSKKFILIK